MVPQYVQPGIASIFWASAANAGVYIWLEYVKSDLNCAGPPSRARAVIGAMKGMTPMVNIGVPNSFVQMLSSRKALNEARFGIKTLLRGAREGSACP